MGTTLHNLTVVENTDLIGILNGREPMGNGYGGASLHQSLQSVLDKTLTLCIES